MPSLKSLQTVATTLVPIERGSIFKFFKSSLFIIFATNWSFFALRIQGNFSESCGHASLLLGK